MLLSCREQVVSDHPSPRPLSSPSTLGEAVRGPQGQAVAVVSPPRGHCPACPGTRTQSAAVDRKSPGSDPPTHQRCSWGPSRLVEEQQEAELGERRVHPWQVSWVPWCQPRFARPKGRERNVGFFSPSSPGWGRTFKKSWVWLGVDLTEQPGPSAAPHPHQPLRGLGSPLPASNFFPLAQSRLVKSSVQHRLSLLPET